MRLAVSSMLQFMAWPAEAFQVGEFYVENPAVSDVVRIGGARDLAVFADWIGRQLAGSKCFPVVGPEINIAVPVSMIGGPEFSGH